MNILNDAAFERETVLNLSDAEPDTVHVWTSQRRIGLWIEKLCKSSGIPLTRTGRPTWEATLPSSVLSLRKSIRKPLSEEEKAKRAARIKAYHEKMRAFPQKDA